MNVANVDPAVSIRIRLEFENIDIIKKLLSTHPVNVSVQINGLDGYGFETTYEPGCYFNPMFDSGILDALSGLKSREEFRMKAKNVAELRVHDERGLYDCDIVCLRRRIEYGHPDREKHTYDIYNSDDVIYFMDYNDYEPYDVNELIFDFGYICNGLSQLIGTYFHAQYPSGPKIDSARDIYNRQRWLGHVQDPDNTIVSNIFNTGRGYCSTHKLNDFVIQFLNSIQNGIEYFKEFGFNEEDMVIRNKS
jgi:hypothetical protein